MFAILAPRTLGEEKKKKLEDFFFFSVLLKSLSENHTGKKIQ